MFFRHLGAQQLFDFEDFLFMDPVGSDQNRHVDDLAAQKRNVDDFVAKASSC